ncbi:MAG: helix-turn-helix transcriptional regulator [Clostridia bacterium]|nr:helix-turn-helix transcriptional regulator [Clostridia bacterium]
MYFGKNLLHLRKKMGGMTQERLAERLNVSRQTVGKWETEEALPEMGKLLEICDLFSVKLDALIREDLSAHAAIYSGVEVRHVPPFRMARYVIISPNCEGDVQAHMRAWAEKSGYAALPKEQQKMIGWDFPFISPEQKNRFNLRGYVAALVLPEGFETDCPGAEIAGQPGADYAVISIREPFVAPFERIPTAYKLILEHLSAKGFREKHQEGVVPCFEYEYEKDGVTYMDVFIHTDSTGKGNLFTGF